MTAGCFNETIKPRLTCLAMAVVGLILVNMATANLGEVHSDVYADLCHGQNNRPAIAAAGSAVVGPVRAAQGNADVRVGREVSAVAGAVRIAEDDADVRVGREVSAVAGAVRTAEEEDATASGLAVPEPARSLRTCLVLESDTAPVVWQVSCHGLAGDGGYSAEDNPLWTLSDETPACALACGL